MQVGKSVRGSLARWHGRRRATAGAWTCVLARRTLNLFALPSGCPPLWLYITRHLPSWHWRQLLLTSDPKTHGSYHTVGFSSPIFTEEVTACRGRGHCSDEPSGRGEELASPCPPPRCAGSSDGLLLRLWLELALIWRICSHVFMDSGLFRIERAGSGGNIGGARQLTGLSGENRSFERRCQATCCFNSPPADSMSSFKPPLLSFWLFFTDIGCFLYSILNCVLTHVLVSSLLVFCVLLQHTL